MTLDHGVLSMPNRTRNINRELDRYKREQEAKAKTDHKAHSANLKERRSNAKALLAEWEDAILTRHGEKMGVSALKKMLRGKAHWEPDWLIRFVEKFKTEEASAVSGRAGFRSPELRGRE